MIFDPMVPWPLLAALALLALAGTAFAFWRRLSGWALRGIAGATSRA